MADNRRRRGVAALLAIGLIATASRGQPIRQTAYYWSDTAWLELPKPAQAGRADVFFIHPTTTLSLRLGNGAAGADLFLNKLSLVNQASVFDRCCRIYAPRYRQVRLRSLAHNAEAFDLAYADVRAAFENFLARIGPTRPFLIAGHSQGAALGLRLLADPETTRVADRLVAAYLPGAVVSRVASGPNVRACRTPKETECLVAWNTVVQPSNNGNPHRDAISRPNEALRNTARKSSLCVNPLNWQPGGDAPASSNLGSLGLRTTDLEGPAPDLIPHLTGARCLDNGDLAVSIPSTAPATFHNLLAALTGSEHLMDFNLFYANIAQNATDRVASWFAAKH